MRSHDDDEDDEARWANESSEFVVLEARWTLKSLAPIIMIRLGFNDGGRGEK
jgi:hypothetical protein